MRTAKREIRASNHSETELSARAPWENRIFTSEICMWRLALVIAEIQLRKFERESTRSVADTQRATKRVPANAGER